MTRLFGTLTGVLLLAAGAAQGQGSYVNFETIPTRPVALSPDGSTLAVTNTPDNRVEIFGVTASGLVHLGGVPVGLEPVAANFRTDDELWVVNHLSDSVSLVDTSQSPPRVTRTLHVGDEPADVVFGGEVAQEGDPFPRAFVSAARRGQNHPADPKTELLTSGIGRADVWVFEATALASDTTLGGTPLTIVQLFGDKPRPLAVSPDGATVYAGIFHSGNQTTSLFVDTVNQLGGLPPPTIDAANPPNAAPDTGLIVKFDGSEWVDQDGTNWSAGVPWDLPDKDVFAIDATASPPVESGVVSTVGTVLFNMATHPTSGKLYVSNTEANNLERFEGRRDTIGNPNGCNQWTSVRGHLHEARVSVVQLPGTNDARHLNKHIVYGPGPAAFDAGKSKADSLATPLGLAFSPDETELYVAAFGSGRIGVFDVAELDANTFSPDSSTHIGLSGGGPAGMAVDAANDRMYVYTRFDNALKTVSNLSTAPSETGSIGLHDVEPARVTDGRSILYDADFSSSNGEASCSSCHVFGNMDDLAWDLGDPCGEQVDPIPGTPTIFQLAPLATPNRFHPLKGPMTTQTLRGMFDMGPMHWRGDRTAGSVGGDPQDAIGAFEEFNVAFDGLLGRDAGQIPGSDMTNFAEFALTLVPPPNPHRDLTNDPENNPGVGDEVNGESLFLNRQTDGGALTCVFCHRWDRTDNSFGGGGLMSEEGEPQLFKIAHFRNLYDKVGLFLANGDQIRGFGFLHDGSVPTVRDFVGAAVFQNLTPGERDDLTAALYAFDSNLAPSVGQQVTLTAANAGTGAVTDRISLLRDAAMDPFVMAEREPDTGPTACPLDASNECHECELTVHGVIGGEPRGWVLDPDTGDYLDDRGNTIAHTPLAALANTAGQELTFTCVYPPGGQRIGVDRDEDGIFDGEQCGDTNGDGLIGQADSLAMQLDFAGLGAMPAPAKCNVVGPAGGAPAECNIADLAAELRHLAGMGPGLAQQCGALSL